MLPSMKDGIEGVTCLIRKYMYYKKMQPVVSRPCTKLKFSALAQIKIKYMLINQFSRSCIFCWEIPMENSYPAIVINKFLKITQNVL